MRRPAICANWRVGHRTGTCCSSSCPNQCNAPNRQHGFERLPRRGRGSIPGLRRQRTCRGGFAQRLRKAGLGCADDALEVLVSRVEGNLLACQQEIDKLALIHPPGTVLSLEQVREAVADGARFDVFQLGEAALAGDLARAQRILASLEEEGVTAPLALWSLVREATTLVDAGARVACGEPTARALTGAGVRAWRTEPYARALARRQPGTLSRLLRMARHADEVVKGARRGDPWGALGELAAAIAGHAGPAAILASEEDR